MKTFIALLAVLAGLAFASSAHATVEKNGWVDMTTKSSRTPPPKELTQAEKERKEMQERHLQSRGIRR